MSEPLPTPEHVSETIGFLARRLSDITSQREKLIQQFQELQEAQRVTLAAFDRCVEIERRLRLHNNDDQPNYSC